MIKTLLWVWAVPHWCTDGDGAKSGTKAEWVAAMAILTDIKGSGLWTRPSGALGTPANVPLIQHCSLQSPSHPFYSESPPPPPPFDSSCRPLTLHITFLIVVHLGVGQEGVWGKGAGWVEGQVGMQGNNRHHL